MRVKDWLQSGQMLVELLIVIALSAIILPALLGGYVTTREGRNDTAQRYRAVLLATEAQEAVRSIREGSWDDIATDGVYHPEVASDLWTLAPGSETTNGFTRTVTISSVYREDGTGAIVESGGELDPSTKQIDVDLSWGAYVPHQLNRTFYFTRYLDNASYAQTTQTEFDTGTHGGTATTLNGDGEVRLLVNTKGKWCEPNLSGTTIDLPAKPNAIWAEEGHIYTASGHTTSSSEVSYEHTLISNTDPPVPTLHGILKGYRTNDVWSDSNHGFIATTNNSKEVVIIDHNSYADSQNKIYNEVGYFNSSGSTNGNSVFVLGAQGYLAAGRYLYVFDLSSTSGSRPQIGSRINFANWGDFAGKIYAVDIAGSRYVFVSIIGSTVDELKVINVTNPSGGYGQWGVVGRINIEPNGCSSLESGQSVHVNSSGTRAYVSSVNDNNFKEFFVVDTSNKFNPSLVGGFATQPTCSNGGGYEAGGMDPSGSTVVNTTLDRAILVGNDAPGGGNSKEYQVLDLTNEGSPSLCGSLDFDQGINGVAAVKESDGDAYAYIITGDSGTDVKIIAGGPDGTYIESGQYESATFDAGKTVVFNGFQSTFTEPASTDYKMQVAVAAPVSGSCSGASYTFVGPDGTEGSFFTSDGEALPLDQDGSGYENPGRCLRYKAYFETTDYNASAVLEDINFNYSP